MRNRESDKITDINVSKDPKVTARSYNNHWGKKCQITNKQLSSSGLGDNILKYISMDGRVVFDIQKEIQKGHSLDSYKLDNVSAHFIKGKIIRNKLFTKTYEENNRTEKVSVMWTSSLGNLKEGDYVTFALSTKYGPLSYMDGKKFKIKKLRPWRFFARFSNFRETSE